MILKDGRVGIVEDATAVITQIAGCEERDRTGSNGRIKENAVAALLNLVSCGGERVVEDETHLAAAVVEGIKEVAVNGSAKGKTKDIALMKVIEGGSSNWSKQFDYLLDQSS
ncbi:uncharacterized protein LOC131169367 [Hevea brasiliensis]|uniref:uncharacterized protein LOC131169367 n=1 Tax=Hevea brasiliensis TaxID=3981 RepID=UPI0025F505C7|nr:uncharacterized protein LOC131169367 [Hevea brasiliensis]